MPDDATVAGSSAQVAGNAAGQVPTPPTGNTPPAQAAGTDPQASPTDVEAALRKELEAVRREAAQHRTENKAFKEAQAAAEAAKLSDLEKASKRADAAEKAAAEYRAKVVSYEVRLQAQALKIVDPELAALAIQGKLEFDDSGNPTNAEALLKDLIKAKPWLLEQGTQTQGNQQQNQRPAANSGGAANPGASARTSAITLSSYKAMSPQERILRNKEVQEVLRQNGGRLPD